MRIAERKSRIENQSTGSRKFANWQFAVCSAAIAFLLASGCAPPTGTISGKITFKGKPLVSGMVAFVHQQGTVVSGAIESDGTYTVRNARLGPTTVTVISVRTVKSTQKPHRSVMWNSQTGEVFLGPEVIEDVASSSAVPTRYKDEKTTPLTHDIVAGEQTYDLDLIAEKTESKK